MTAKTTDGDNQLEYLIDQIKQQIIFGRLRPRERLIEDELSERYQASRHLIRSAFAELERMGLVNRRPNKGAIVRDFSVREVEEIYEMRAVLQAEAARRIPLPVSKDLIEKLEAVHQEHGAAIEAQQPQRVCSINNTFHRLMFAASGNRYLAEQIERMWIETLGIRCYAIGDPQMVARSHEEHGAMLDALRAGDRERLVHLVVEHIWPALEAYKRAHGGWAVPATPMVVADDSSALKKGKGKKAGSMPGLTAQKKSRRKPAA